MMSRGEKFVGGGFVAAAAITGLVVGEIRLQDDVEQARVKNENIYECMDYITAECIYDAGIDIAITVSDLTIEDGVATVSPLYFQGELSDAVVTPPEQMDRRVVSGVGGGLVGMVLGGIAYGTKLALANRKMREKKPSDSFVHEPTAST